MASQRLLAGDARHLSLPLDPGGTSPATRSEALGRVGVVEVGLWEIDAGHAEDTEADEVFVVLAGRGSVAFADGSQIELRPGVVVRLRAGDRTRWTIHERLRKVYVLG
jgi:uncharacterized protein